MSNRLRRCRRHDFHGSDRRRLGAGKVFKVNGRSLNQIKAPPSHHSKLTQVFTKNGSCVDRGLLRGRRNCIDAQILGCTRLRQLRKVRRGGPFPETQAATRIHDAQADPAREDICGQEKCFALVLCHRTLLIQFYLARLIHSFIIAHSRSQPRQLRLFCLTARKHFLVTLSMAFCGSQPRGLSSIAEVEVVESLR